MGKRSGKSNQAKAAPEANANAEADAAETTPLAQDETFEDPIIGVGIGGVHAHPVNEEINVDEGSLLEAINGMSKILSDAHEKTTSGLLQTASHTISMNEKVAAEIAAMSVKTAK